MIWSWQWIWFAVLAEDRRHCGLKMVISVSSTLVSLALMEFCNFELSHSLWVCWLCNLFALQNECSQFNLCRLVFLKLHNLLLQHNPRKTTLTVQDQASTQYNPFALNCFKSWVVSCLESWPTPSMTCTCSVVATWAGIFLAEPHTNIAAPCMTISPRSRVLIVWPLNPIICTPWAWTPSNSIPIFVLQSLTCSSTLLLNGWLYSFSREIHCKGLIQSIWRQFAACTLAKLVNPIGTHSI